MITFDDAFDRLMGHEGGYVFHPRDPGGETKWGISKRQYPHENIFGLTRDQAKVIYKRDFWDECGKSLDDGVMWQVFDAAVNHGMQTAIRMLQRAVGTADDGHWGPNSQSKYEKLSEAHVIMLFLSQRLHFMRRLSTFPTFGAGWAGRIADNLVYGVKDS